MDLLTIGIVILVGVILIELSKHFFTKTVLKFVIMLIVGIILFFAVVSSLDSNTISNTDNEYVQTGAVIISNINEQPLVLNVKENMKSLLNEIKDKIVNGND